MFVAAQVLTDAGMEFSEESEEDEIEPQVEAQKLARDGLENGTEAVAFLHRTLLSARIREMVE